MTVWCLSTARLNHKTGLFSVYVTVLPHSSWYSFFVQSSLSEQKSALAQVHGHYLA